MRLGHDFDHHKIPHWATFYMDYNRLKKLVKSIHQTADGNTSEEKIAILYSCLHHEAVKVDNFYTKKYAEVKHDAADLAFRYGCKGRVWVLPDGNIDHDELRDICLILIEQQHTLQDLEWYRKVNEDGFQAIAKKISRLRVGPFDEESIETKVQPEFSCRPEVLSYLERIDQQCLNPAQERLEAACHTSTQSHWVKEACAETNSGTRLDEITQLIRQDDATTLGTILTKLENQSATKDVISRSGTLAHGRLLRYAISKRAMSCADLLSKMLGRTRVPQVWPIHSFVHDVVMNIGRRKQLEQLTHPQKFTNEIDEPVREVQFLDGILKTLSIEQRHALAEKDYYGRLPLHYAALFGLPEVYKLLVRCMLGWNLATNPILLEDKEGLTPLHLAVVGGHLTTFGAILDQHLETRTDTGNSETSDEQLSSNNILEIALKSSVNEMCHALISNGIGLTFRGTHRETPLHTAASMGLANCVELIIEMFSKHDLDTDAEEDVNGRTPLILACIDGHLAVVELLLTTGADVQRRDFFGWTCLDHAAYRGHLHIIRSQVVEDAVAASDPDNSSGLVKSVPPRHSKETSSPSHGSVKLHPDAPLKTVCVIVTPGALGIGAEFTSVKLADLDASRQLTNLRLEISTCGRSDHAVSYMLPMLESKVNEPFVFDTEDARKTRIMFKVYRTTKPTPVKPVSESASKVLVGSGIALPANIGDCLGQKRESLVRHHTIPLLTPDDMDFAGTVTFGLQVVKPFSHPNMHKTKPANPWSNPPSTLVVGHRGIGENVTSRKNLQLGENTIQSFKTAIDHGAHTIETDVQLTKDLIPVLYHDFTVCETGLDATMNMLSFDQFMHLDAVQSSGTQTPAVVKQTNGIKIPRRSLSFAMDSSQMSRAEDLRKRMEGTFEFKLRGVKGNTLDTAVRQPFVTLDQLLSEMPYEVPVNIEIKYPMLTEATEEWYLDPYAIEVNLLVDTILNTIFSSLSPDNQRPIVFASFSPEICIAVRLKQSTYPVYFLTESGHVDTGDVRARSVQQALHFARAWGLAGTVQRTDPLIAAPRLVEYCKQDGLGVISWGPENDEPENARLLAKAGLDALIVNKVRKVVGALSESATNGNQGID